VDAFDFVPALMNRELSLIEEKITSLREDFRGLDSVLTNVTRKTREIGSQKSAPARSKRGLFNFVGEASSFLFGTLAESHLQQLNERISDAETNGKLIYNMETEMATLINTTHAGVRQNREALDKITNITSDLMKKIEDRQAATETDLQNTFTYLDKTTFITTNLRMLEKIISDFEYELRSLSEAWSALSKNELSPTLFKTYLFVQFLMSIAPILPTGCSLPYAVRMGIGKQ